MNFLKTVLPFASALCFASAAVANPAMNCHPTFNGETCETSQFIFEITFRQTVTVIEKAVPGATGDSRDLTYSPGVQTENPFGEEVYLDGRYRVEVGHTNGTSIYLRIGNKTWNFFHEVGTP